MKSIQDLPASSPDLQAQLDAANARIAELEAALEAIRKAVKLPQGYNQEPALDFLKRLAVQRNNVIVILKDVLVPEPRS